MLTHALVPDLMIAMRSSLSLIAIAILVSLPLLAQNAQRPKVIIHSAESPDLVLKPLIKGCGDLVTFCRWNSR